MSSEHVEVLREMKGWRMPPIGGSAYNAALDAAIASLSAPQPEGEWVLVPREPSAGMWDSAENAMIEAECAYNEGNQDARSDAHSFPTMRIWQAVVGYRAMVAAAPQPPARMVGCEGDDGLIRTHPEAETCDVCAPKPEPAEAQEVMCLECGQPTMPMGQVCYACSHPAEKPAEAQAQGGGEVVAWRVPVLQSPFGEWLDHGVRDGLVLVMHRGTHGWKAAGQGRALLAHQIYVKNVEPLCATSREVAVVGLSGGGWRTVWARSDDDVTHPAPPSAPVGAAGDAVEKVVTDMRKQAAELEGSGGCEDAWAHHQKKFADRLDALAQQPAAFRNNGNSEAEFIADDAIACTACGGSGHRDDQQPAAVDSEMVTRAVNAYDEATGEGWQMPCLQGMRAALTAALSQRPAAVDGAVVGQASGFIEFDYSDDDNCACCPGKHAYCRRVKWDGQSAKDMVDEFARKHANEGKRVLVTLTVAGQQGGEK